MTAIELFEFLGRLMNANPLTVKAPVVLYGNHDQEGGAPTELRDIDIIAGKVALF